MGLVRRLSRHQTARSRKDRRAPEGDHSGPELSRGIEGIDRPLPPPPSREPRYVQTGGAHENCQPPRSRASDLSIQNMTRHDAKLEFRLSSTSPLPLLTVPRASLSTSLRALCACHISASSQAGRELIPGAIARTAVAVVTRPFRADLHGRRAANARREEVWPRPSSTTRSVEFVEIHEALCAPDGISLQSTSGNPMSPVGRRRSSFL